MMLKLLHEGLTLMLLELEPDFSRIPLLALSGEHPIEYLHGKHGAGLLTVDDVEVGDQQRYQLKLINNSI